GLVVSCQNEKSQLQNKESALRVLRAPLHQLAVEEAEAQASAARRSQVRTVDRSERIRTYNFPENRIADHRTGFKSYNLDQVLDGDLDPVEQSAVEADEAARLSSLGQSPIFGEVWYAARAFLGRFRPPPALFWGGSVRHAYRLTPGHRHRWSPPSLPGHHESSD